MLLSFKVKEKGNHLICRSRNAMCEGPRQKEDEQRGIQDRAETRKRGLLGVRDRDQILGFHVYGYP